MKPWSTAMRALCVVSLAVAGAGCKPKTRDLPICPAMVAAGKSNEADPRDLPVDVWFSVLVRTFNRSAMDAGDEPRECSNQPIEVKWPVAMTGDPRASARKLTREPRTDKDITFSELDEGELLVWARIDELENGDAIGPIAAAHWIPRGVEIRGIGSIQAPAQRVRMRLEPLGEYQVLVLESETCPKDDPQGKCAREAQIVPLAEQRFVSAPLIEAGKDAGPARFLLSDSREEPMKDGWVRRFELTRRLEFEGGKALLEENIKTRDCDPKSPATPCEEHVAASEKRSLEFKDGALHTTPGAWERVGKTAAP